MKVLIIEDETLTARRLQNLLQTYDPSIQVLALLPSVTKTLQWFADHESNLHPDLVFMDIHLEDDTAFRIIEQLQLTIPIIFTTAYDDYMLQAFKANSIDYLLKPIDEDELFAAITKFRTLRYATHTDASQDPGLAALLGLFQQSQPASYKDRFMITIGTKIRSIETNNIAYFFFENKSTFLTTHEAQNLCIDYSLDKLAGMLDPHRFFRINRSFLVSLPAIRTIYAFSGSKLKVDLAPAPRQEVFVSGDRITAFKEWLGK
jgi:DNA-binding LytR/AlgR family response regulator